MRMSKNDTTVLLSALLSVGVLVGSLMWVVLTAASTGQRAEALFGAVVYEPTGHLGLTNAPVLVGLFVVSGLLMFGLRALFDAVLGARQHDESGRRLV